MKTVAMEPADIGCYYVPTGEYTFRLQYLAEYRPRPDASSPETISVIPGDHSMPRPHVEFGKEIAALCRKYRLRNFSARYAPGFDDPWQDEVDVSWDNGRHGDRRMSVRISSTVQVHVTMKESTR